MPIIATLVIVILASYVLSLAAQKLQLSVIIGMIILGVIIGSPWLKDIIIGQNTEFISVLGNIGLISLMFLAGMKVSRRMLVREEKDAFWIASFGAFIPLILGFSIFYFLGFSFLSALTIGICMSITAEATKARVLLELNKLNTKIGALMIEAGIIDDIIGIGLFIPVGYWFAKDFAFQELLLLGIVISAFFAGILTHRLLVTKDFLMKYAGKFLLIFIVPFFFISMGIHFNLNSIILDPSLLILIVIISITGKIAGAMITKPFTKLRWKQLYLIGWGMNSRGALEIAIAFIAFKNGLFNSNVYSSLVMMALVTTLIFPLIIRKMIKKEPDIMD